MSANIPELVIRKVTSNITTFSKPFKVFGILPWGGRSTAIRLNNGSVWVLASTPLTIDTKATLDAMGPVKWIMAGDVGHYLFIAEFAKAYPDAKVIAVKDLVQKLQEKDVRVDGAYGSDPEGTMYGFEEEIQARYFSGFANKDVAWVHGPSKTLVVADLIFNLPGTEQHSKSKASSKVPLLGSLKPSGSVHKTFVYVGQDKVAMKRDVHAVAGWDFDRIIMCHGDVIETGGKAQWKEAYAKYFP
ncbi:hypothetical protein DL96DRAFT_1591694 [Flagelloscypha sp. PMI_526]|nr:hypothetical protein DL96DRAFT_1591694 [Flagelloscypha sp. PMI_526]